MQTERMNDRRVGELRTAALTYCEVGQTRQPDLPAGYRTFSREAVLPPQANFAAVRRDLLSWVVQHRAGIRVTASRDVSPDAVVELRLGIMRLAVVAPCRVVYVIDESDRCGFAYGTLPGHPEIGEEAFVLNRHHDATITLTITGFSRRASSLAKLAGPAGRRIQDLMTARYLRAFDN